MTVAGIGQSGPGRRADNGSGRDDGEVTPIIDPALLPANFASDYVTVAVPTTEANHEIVRTALAGAAGSSPIESREARLADQQSQLDDILRVTVIGLIAATVLSGCGAAIATAGALMDRRRTYGALIAAGTEVNVLAKALRTEAALPALVATVGADADYVLLIKPQFEVGRQGVREGIVRDPAAREEAIMGVLWAAADEGLAASALLSSPIVGTHGNHEYLAVFRRAHGVDPSQWRARAAELARAHVTGGPGAADQPPA